MRSVWSLFLCALLALNVLAESEYVHAKELIYFYTNYILEGDVYGRDSPNDAWINQCRQPGKGRCGFNEVGHPILPKKSGSSGQRSDRMTSHSSFTTLPLANGRSVTGPPSFPPPTEGWT